MNFIDQTALEKLEMVSFNETDHDIFHAIVKGAHALITDRMDPKFARYLIGHSKRMVPFQEQLLIANDVPPEIARERSEDMLMHDIGKGHVMQLPYWKITAEKPLKDEFVKDQQNKHGELGPVVLKTVMDDLGLTMENLSHALQKKLRFSEVTMISHHAPYNVGMDIFNACSCVTDSIDGQLKTLSQIPPEDQPAEVIHSLRLAAIEKLRGDKYAGLYMPGLLDKAVDVTNILKPANQSLGLEINRSP